MRNRLIPRLLTFALVLGPISGHAQTVAPQTVAPQTVTPQAAVPQSGTTSPATQPTRPPRQTFLEHFDSANTTHDGHLTLDQAKAAKWTAVIRRVDKIDTDHKGYVTAQQLRDQFARERAEKAKANGTAPAANAGTKS